MNKERNVFKFMLAAMCALAVAFVGCPNDPSGPGNLGDPEGTPFSLSGSFVKDGDKTVQFQIWDTATGRSARAVGSDSYAVSGVLEDDDFIIRLSGTYDPLARTYSVSASANTIGIRYSINGSFSESGTSLASTATVAVRDPGTQEWTAVTYVVDNTATVEIDIDTAEITESDTTGGIPAFGQGWWNFTYSEEGYSVDARILATQWSLNIDSADTDGDQTSYNSARMTIVEVTGSGPYDVVSVYPQYQGTETQITAAVNKFKTDELSAYSSLPFTKLDSSPWGSNTDPFEGQTGNVYTVFMRTYDNPSGGGTTEYADWRSNLAGTEYMNVQDVLNAFPTRQNLLDWLAEEFPGYAIVEVGEPAGNNIVVNDPDASTVYYYLEEDSFYFRVTIYDETSEPVPNFDLNRFHDYQYGWQSSIDACKAKLEAIFAELGIDCEFVDGFTAADFPIANLDPGIYWWIEDYDVRWTAQPDLDALTTAAQLDAWYTAVWAKLNKWHLTNYLETYLLSHYTEQLAVETLYVKYRFAFSNGNNTLTITPYFTAGGNSFVTSQTAVNTLTEFDPDNGIQVRR